MNTTWVVLSKKRVETIQQNMLPVLQTLGKNANLFPLYIQTHSHKDVEGVRNIHEPLLKLCAKFSDSEQLARAIHHTINCSGITNNGQWYVLLNGRSFRGILCSPSDLDAQTRDFWYSSWRKVESFKDALLIMVLKGEKGLLTNIKASSPSTLSTVTDLDDLTISSLSMHDDNNLKMSPSISACGKKPAQLPSTFPWKPSPSTESPRAPKESKFKFRTPPTLMSYSQWPRSPVQLPGNGFSLKPIYKYIRNIAGTVGTITNRSGVLSHVSAEDYRVLGYLCASYLDSHGYGAAEVDKIVLAFDAPTIEEFVAHSKGSGMSIVELEWFWALSTLSD